MAPGQKRKTVSEEASQKRPATAASTTTNANANGKALHPVTSAPTNLPMQPTEAPSSTLSSGDLLVYGNNEAGQLGLEDPEQSKRYPFHLVPDRVGGHPIQAVICGGMHSLVINTAGQVYSWGCNDEGALGTDPGDEDSWRPKLVALGQKVTAVTAGDSHTAFLTEKGQVWLTGTMRDGSGAFGLNKKSSEIQKVPFLHLDSKSRDVENVIRDVPLKISSGANHFAVMNKKHEIFLLGDSSNSQLGPIPERRKDGGRDGRGYFLQRRLVHVEVGKKRAHFADVWCLPYATFVRVKDEDRWFACGNNQRNQLGFPNEEKNGIQEEWREVVGLQGKNVVKIVGSNIHTVALTKEGHLYVFGSKEYLGLSAEEDNTCTTEPVLLPICSSILFADVGCSSNNATVAVSTTGDLYAWGSPSSSLIGTDDQEEDAIPLPTKIVSKNTAAFKLLQVSVGGAHALLVGQKREESATPAL